VTFQYFNDSHHRDYYDHHNVALWPNIFDTVKGWNLLNLFDLSTKSQINAIVVQCRDHHAFIIVVIIINYRLWTRVMFTEAIAYERTSLSATSTSPSCWSTGIGALDVTSLSPSLSRGWVFPSGHYSILHIPYQKFALTRVVDVIAARSPARLSRVALAPPVPPRCYSTRPSPRKPNPSLTNTTTILRSSASMTSIDAIREKPFRHLPRGLLLSDVPFAFHPTLALSLSESGVTPIARISPVQSKSDVRLSVSYALQFRWIYRPFLNVPF